MSRLRRTLVLLLANIVTLAVLVAGAEVAFRLFSDQSASSNANQWMRFAPFVMFANPHVVGAFQWVDSFHDRKIIGQMTNNEYGFAMKEEVDFAAMRPKATNERVVIFTGGSAAWGVGATSNATSVPGRLETILNESQLQYHYTVLNMAMGGWVSFQQYVALALFGRNVQPDWLVSMDGTNDVAVACAHSQGAGLTMHYALMDAYIKAYTFGQLRPVFYRGWLENELIKHSAAYRKLTGKSPVEFDVILDKQDPGIGRSVIFHTSWRDVQRQLEFYIQTESEMLDVLPGAKAILSTQPLPFDFEEMFGRVYQTRGSAGEEQSRTELNERLAKLDAVSQNKDCGLNQWDDARRWFMPMSALRLEAMVERRRSEGRNVQYVNPGVLFPNSFIDRTDFFIDPVHLNDAGMDVVARQYAKMILASDLPDKFEKPQWTGVALPDFLPAAAPTPDQIRVVSATYGMNCRDTPVPTPYSNSVAPGNATQAVLAACVGRKGTCAYRIDTTRLGDPANGCGKDFNVSWRCGIKNDVHQEHIDGEANERTVTLTCFGQ